MKVTKDSECEADRSSNSQSWHSEFENIDQAIEMLTSALSGDADALNNLQMEEPCALDVSGISDDQYNNYENLQTPEGVADMDLADRANIDITDLFPAFLLPTMAKDLEHYAIILSVFNEDDELDNAGNENHGAEDETPPPRETRRRRGYGEKRIPWKRPRAGSNDDEKSGDGDGDMSGAT